MSAQEEVGTDNRDPLSLAEFAALMARARHREDAAVAALYRRALPMIYRYVTARLGPGEVTEDVVSDVFLDMVVGIEKVRADHEAGFYTWLLQIAHAKVARALQRRTTIEALLLPLPGDQEHMSERRLYDVPDTDVRGDPQAIQELTETIAELGVAMDALTESQKVVIIGRFLLGRSIEELAHDLRKQPGAIRALQYRALELLAGQMGVQRRSTGDGRKGGQA